MNRCVYHIIIYKKWADSVEKSQSRFFVVENFYI